MILALAVAVPTAIGLVLVSGLLSASGTALTVAGRERMHRLEREGDRAAARVNRLIADQESLAGAILLGSVMADILAALIAAGAVLSILPGPAGLALTTAAMAVVILIFGEVLPRTVAVARPDDVARALSAPTAAVVRLLGPAAFAVQGIVRKALAPFGLAPPAERGVLAVHEEIRGAVEHLRTEEGEGGGERRMLGGVLDLSDMAVSQIMVHRKSMALLDADEPPGRIVRQVLDAPYTRLPLYRDEPENIVGVLHAKDLLRAVAADEGAIDRLDVMAVAREPWFIPDTTNLKDQLDAFLKARSHFALVVDEYGALQGLVTLEDILEEIVGEIEDEHDAAVQGLRRQPDGSVNVDGWVALRDLNRAMDWDLPDEDAVTVAGLVIHEAQAIPDPGQTFIFHGHRFHVLRRQRNQIAALRVSPPLGEAGP